MFTNKFTKSIFAVIASCTSLLSTATFLEGSQLDYLIGPEIKHDSFYNAIFELASKENIKTVLEIGSSSGDGSTEAFVLGLRQNPNNPLLFCMEVSKPRYAALKKRYEKDTFVRCYNVSSVPLKSFPSEEEVSTFYNTTLTSLHDYPLTQVLGWLRQDIEYVKSAGVPQTGIQIIKAVNNIQTFDMVLIDGSEFTGIAEFDLIYGARFILLDDINAFKNYANYTKLMNDPNYTPIEVNHYLRNGYAIFEKNTP